MKTRLLGAILWTVGAIMAQTQPKAAEFVPFKTFLDRTAAANSLEFIGPMSEVKDAAAFEEMRQHIENIYRGVEVAHSFVLHSSHFDCVPVAQQPTVSILGLRTIADAPPQSALTAPTVSSDLPDYGPFSAAQSAQKTDEFGNSIGCEHNTIPMRRITLEEMIGFPTLRDFFQKGPGIAGRPIKSFGNGVPAATSVPAHKYSVMMQQVNNLGGNSNLNLWSPYVNTPWGEIFSLSQEWYVAGSGTSLQTAEVGWQNYPAKYGSQSSRLFIYWTADDYAKTGCYNLECPAFVQISNLGILGGGFTEYSSYGGPQYEFSAQYYLYQGNWWLAIQGTWIGYYPGTVYGGGQLARNAQVIEFGTESVGTTVWPAEGSGYWATAGWESAAYQRNLFYIDLSGAAVGGTLIGYDPSRACYNTSGPFFSMTSGWGVYFYEGGPGGSGC